MNAPLEASLVPGISPQVYHEQDFDRIARMVRREAGIVLDEKKRMLAYSRLAPLVRRSGLQTFSDYLNQVESDASARTAMIASLTTNHTYFNREPHHFEHFAAEVRPDLIARAEAGQTVRIWSAGCSSGEEIYTLLMVLLGEDRKAGERLAQRKIIALASDLADHAVRAAEEGIYAEDALAKVPARLRTNWCEAGPAGPSPRLSIGRDIRRMLRCRQLNLLHPWPFKAQFDVIFCRNVMIYFDRPTKEQLVLGFARHLRPGGHLYIGHSERVSGPARDLLEPVGNTIYQRRSA